ncbi:MAG: ATP-binding protein [Deltaproteobacteria bacterium]|nr:ATP-binding protein [Deltaproteobacteria bacterium]
MLTQSIPAVVMAGITFFVGAYFLLLYFRRGTRREDLAFALTCLSVGCYDTFCALLYSAGSPAEGAVWQRWQLTSLAVMAVAFVWFASEYLGSIPRAFKWVVTAVFAILALAQALDRSALTWRVPQPLVKRVDLPFGLTVTYQEVVTGPLATVQGGVSLVAFLYVFVASLRLRLEGERRAFSLLAIMSCFFAAVANDTCVNAGVYSFVYLMEYGYMGMVLLMTYYLSSEIIEVAQVKQERAHLEEQLRQAQKMEAIGRLAGGVAHDLNNQLTPVVGYAEIALRRKDVPDEVRAFLEQIRESAEHAADLTRQLLAFGRKQVLNLAVVDVNRVVSDSERMLRRMIREDLGFSLRLGGDAGHARADETQLRQILTNLVLNASDATPAGGMVLIETAREAAPDDSVVLAVSDTGSGMDAETLAHIFEPFFTTKDRGERSGLGLATVYGIVTQHGGRVSVASEPGRGTSFRVVLPRVVEPEQARVPSLAPSSADGTETVLVVEDEEAVRKMACEILEDHGYRVMDAGSAAEALAISGAFAGEIHLLLTDVVMPRMNGRELHDRLAETRPGMKVLFMSGYPDDVVAGEGVPGAGAGFVQKPFSVQALADSVRRVLDVGRVS